MLSFFFYCSASEGFDFLCETRFALVIMYTLNVVCGVKRLPKADEEGKKFMKYAESWRWCGLSFMEIYVDVVENKLVEENWQHNYFHCKVDHWQNIEKNYDFILNVSSKFIEFKFLFSVIDNSNRCNYLQPLTIAIITSLKYSITSWNRDWWCFAWFIELESKFFSCLIFELSNRFCSNSLWKYL